MILDTHYATRDKCREDLKIAHRTLVDTIRLVEYLRLEYEEAKDRLRDADMCVGQTRSRLRACGVLPRVIPEEGIDGIWGDL